MPEIPNKDFEFNEYANEAIPHLDTNKVRLGVTDPNINTLNGYLADWNVKFPLSQSDITRTTKITKEKDILRGQIERQIRKICKDIPDSALTVEDRLILRMKKRDSIITPVGILDYAPEGIVEQIKHLIVSFRFNDPETATSQKMPKGQHIQLFVGFKDLVTGVITWDIELYKEVHEYLTDIIFRQEHIGKKVVFRYRYANTKGEIAVWGNDIEITII